MASPVTEGYNPVKLAASGTISALPAVVSHFIASTSGTLQLREGGAGGTIVVASMSVTAGNSHYIGLNFGANSYAELGGGATGTFGVSN